MKQLNRWVYAIVGVIVLLFAGLVYAWSVLSTPIGAEFTGWTKAQLSLTFTLVMILFCIGSLVCGLLAGRLSAKNGTAHPIAQLVGAFIHPNPERLCKQYRQRSCDLFQSNSSFPDTYTKKGQPRRQVTDADSRTPTTTRRGRVFITRCWYYTISRQKRV